VPFLSPPRRRFTHDGGYVLGSVFIGSGTFVARDRCGERKGAAGNASFFLPVGGVYLYRLSIIFHVGEARRRDPKIAIAWRFSAERDGARNRNRALA
jgi:hypothetical protein